MSTITKPSRAVGRRQAIGGLARAYGLSLLVGLGCLEWGCVSDSAHPDQARRSWVSRLSSGQRERSQHGTTRSVPPEFWGMPSELARSVARKRITLSASDVPLFEVLHQLVELSDLTSFTGDPARLALPVRASYRDAELGEIFQQLSNQLETRFQFRERSVHVATDPAWPLAWLAYPLNHGLIQIDRPLRFDSIEQLSFISRAQSSPTTVASRSTEPVSFQPVAELGGADSSRTRTPRAHLHAFLETLPEMFDWPEGSGWYFNPATQVLLVRSSPAALRSIRHALDVLCQKPIQIEIETRFVEVDERFTRDLGAEFRLREDYAVRRASGEPQVAIGGDSGTRFGVPELFAAGPDGGRLTVLGLLTQPRFEALLRAFEEDGEAEIISSPSITTVNNVRATLAITTNLPFVEGYRPVIDRELVASEGLSRSESSVALVAEINDTNFTGIVLNVTPSVGHRRDAIHLVLQPVVRDQVDSITISTGALIEGVATPAITRPIIETRFLDAQLSVEPGQTVVLGGLESSQDRKVSTGIPILRSIPILGHLFRREITQRERRQLLILVTARIAE